MRLADIEEILTKSELPQSFNLSEAETVTDVPYFVRSHIETLKGNPRNQRFVPYFNRLKLLAEMLKRKV